MAKFRVLAENYFNTHQFPAHTISDSTGSNTGNEEWRVGTGRRSELNYWQAGTTGTVYNRVTCDQVRAPDMIALDGHNLTGKTVALQYTSSTAAGWHTSFSVTVPSATYPGSALEDAPGALAEDKLWVYRFASSANAPAATDFRVQVSALGGQVKAKIGLAWLGQSAAFGPALRPWDDEVRTLSRGARVTSALSGQLVARLNDREVDLARYHVGDLCWSAGDPFVLVSHPNMAERAVVARATDGTRSMPYPSDWPHRVLQLDWTEHSPRPR